MKQKIGIAVTFIAVYFVFLVVLAPVSLIKSWITLPNNIELHSLSGTLWQPNLARLDIENLSVYDIEARLSPLSLLLFSPKVNAEFGGGLNDGPQGKATLELSSDLFSLTNTYVEFPANLVVPYIQSLLPVEAFGLVVVNVQELVMKAGSCVVAKGDVNWRSGAVSALNETVEVGNFNGNLSCESSLLTLTITPDNNLGLSFKAQVSHTGRIGGNGFVKPGKNFPSKLNDVLSFIGRPDNQGRYRVRF